MRRIRKQDELTVVNAALREEVMALRKSQKEAEKAARKRAAGVLTAAESLTGNDPTEEKASDTLHDAFVRLMIEQKYYTQFKVNRTDVAQLLDVSGKVLSHYVREQYHLSFPAYVAHLRLEHAKRAMSDVNNKSTLEKIGLDAGFGSRSSFHRQFREVYGLSPEEFRREWERM